MTGSADGRRAVVAVHDDGPGVAADEGKRLFRPFHKSATEAAHSQPGVGLGLALSRRLAKALGGSLELSNPGEPGAEFRLELPLGYGRDGKAGTFCSRPRSRLAAPTASPAATVRLLARPFPSFGRPGAPLDPCPARAGRRAGRLGKASLSHPAGCG